MKNIIGLMAVALLSLGLIATEVTGADVIDPPASVLDVVVDVYCNEYFDLNNHAGADDLATDNFDPDFDIPEPAPPPQNYLTASFNQQSWPLGPRFRTMVHGSYNPEENLKSWPLRIETDQVGLVELVFTPDFDQAANIPLVIKDLETGQSFNLFPDLTFTYENNNTSARNFLIVVGVQGPPPLWPETKNISPGWALVGLPLIPTPGQDSLAETMLAQISGVSYVYRYLGEDGYELEAPEETAIHGRGYWLGVTQTNDWTMEGEMAFDPVNIPLIPGWNLLGYPLWFLGSVGNIWVEYQDVTYPWDQAVADDLVINSVIGFDTSSDQYQIVNSLEPWTGYWFGALEEGVSLVFEWENFVDMPDLARNPDRTEYPPELNWSTELSVTDTGGHSHQVSFGVHPSASVGFDSHLDIPLAPPGPYENGYLGIVRPEWGLPMGDKYFRDLVAPDGQPLVWNTELSVADAGHVTLQWNRLNWPLDLDLEIFIPSENRVALTSMRAQNSLRLAAPEGFLEVQFRTPSVSGINVLPVSGHPLSIHPNPFNPQTTISFELQKEGEVEVRIYSLRGEMVSVLRSEATGLGRHDVVWTGQNRAGRDVPSGSYFARMYLDGKAVGAVAKMSLVR